MNRKPGISFQTVSRAVCCSMLMPGDNVVDSLAFLVALHDIGKCHPYFQSRNNINEYIRFLHEVGKLSLQPHPYRHEIGSKYILESILSKQQLSPKVLRAMGSILRLHHQKGTQQIFDIIIPENLDRSFWEEMQTDLFKAICDIFHPNFSLFESCSNIDALGVLLWGCTVLSDWLSSDNSFSIDEELKIDDYIIESYKTAQKVLNSSDLQIKECLQASNFCHLWNFKPDNLRPLQKACQESVDSWYKEKNKPAFILLEAPMGEGKTEAGLFLTTYLMKWYKKTGFYIAMPTSATSNSMYDRVQKLLTNHNITGIKLMHSQSWMIEGNVKYKGETEDAQEASAWLSPLRKGMLSQYAVC